VDERHPSQLSTLLHTNLPPLSFRRQNRTERFVSPNMSPSIATHIKRAIHAGTSGVSRVVFRRDAYKSKPIIRAYITHYVTRECNKPGGLNSQGAVFAELRYVHLSRIADVRIQSVFSAVHATMEEPTRRSRSTAHSSFATRMVIPYRRSTRKRA
jgi:hypothetical protein